MKNKEKISPISLVILVHQEADLIESVISDFYQKVVSKIPGSEFIVCEDGSTDGTKEILERIKFKYNLTLYMGNERRGYTLALREALSKATKPIIFFSDSDGQHDPDDFWIMLNKLGENDEVVGYKQARKDGFIRLVTTKIFNKIFNLYFKIPLHDINCGFRVMKKSLVDYLLRQPWYLKYCINAELTARSIYAGFKIVETPVKHFARIGGVSRGLPMNKLPNVVGHILKMLPKIKKEISLTKPL
jgi:glycosyltransferase involved in cell wall biosynthesis